MKISKLISTISFGALAVVFVACKNDDKSFPDYDGGTSAYFAYQYPIRTLILGNIETYDNTSDNEWRFTIYGTCGGSYSGLNAKIDVKIDESLTEGLYFEDSTKVKPMPKEYYTCSGDVLDYAGGFRGGIEIQLNENFFNDPLSITNNYVIPVVMGENFSGVDHIVRGTPATKGTTPSRHDIDKWDVTPGDYTLFCVNYINEYTATYLRRGVDNFDQMQFENTDIPDEDTYIVVRAGEKESQVWDSQFWINVDVDFAKGDEWEFSMKYKADSVATATTQMHADPGVYVHYEAIGDIKFTTEWQVYTRKGKFPKEVVDANGVVAHSIAFNLNEYIHANNYYFDSISFKIGGQEYITNINCDKVSNCENFFQKEKNGEVFKSIYESESTAELLPVGYAQVTANRHGKFIENDEVVSTKTMARNKILLPIATTEINGKNSPCELILTFDASGNCTIESNTQGCTASGTGRYSKGTAIKAWGDKDRDELFLDYTLDFEDAVNNKTVHYATKDTLVWRDRGTVAGIQTYKPIYIEE